ncbi:hypothetical protein ACWPKO_07975 [Coraliomargarita sp. W4R53]
MKKIISTCFLVSTCILHANNFNFSGGTIDAEIGIFYLSQGFSVSNGSWNSSLAYEGISISPNGSDINYELGPVVLAAKNSLSIDGSSLIIDFLDPVQNLSFSAFGGTDILLSIHYADSPNSEAKLQQFELGGGHIDFFISEPTIVSRLEFYKSPDFDLGGFSNEFNEEFSIGFLSFTNAIPEVSQFSLMLGIFACGLVFKRRIKF